MVPRKYAPYRNISGVFFRGEAMKEKSILEKEISMTKFLSLFLGINPAKARYITHEDARVLFPNLQIMTDREFWDRNTNEDLVNYVKVKDKNKQTMYYKKIIISNNYEPYDWIVLIMNIIL